MVVVAAIGIFTAILAASIALTQTDIKRVLAYSTLSQLGYMFAALGVGAYVAAIFHLMTHGFFKGLLFLDSGSVIHAVHGEQDMNRMGGLWRKIPITHATMLVGALAIAGIPPLSGFFSKDEILGESFKFGFYWVWAVGVLVAALNRLLHVPAHGQDVLRAEPRRPAGGGQGPRIPSVDDDPARSSSPSRPRFAGSLVGWPPGSGPIYDVARAGLRGGARRTLGRRPPNPSSSSASTAR